MHIFTSLTALAMLSFASTAIAVKSGEGGSCSQANNHLSIETKQFTSDCSPMHYCASDSKCRRRKCRRDEYPFGYPPYFDDLPHRCEPGHFCPDEEDACQPLLPVDSLCQLNRDDQCQPPPNARELASSKNHHGSICLNYRCMYSNVTVGNECVVENTPYYAYEAGSGKAFINVVSRDNCVASLYCDAVSLKCLKTKAIGEGCSGDKECETNNCNEKRVCAKDAAAAKHFPAYVYVLVGFFIFVAVFMTLGTLFVLHKRHRNEEREKRMQYWQEQEQFRQNIMQMREQAQVSLLSLPWKDQPQSPRERDRDYQSSENSQTGILHAAGQPSGLRNDMSVAMYDDDSRGSFEDAIVMKAGSPGGERKKSKRRI